MTVSATGQPTTPPTANQLADLGARPGVIIPGVVESTRATRPQSSRCCRRRRSPVYTKSSRPLRRRKVFCKMSKKEPFKTFATPSAITDLNRRLAKTLHDLHFGENERALLTVFYDERLKVR